MRVSSKQNRNLCRKKRDLLWAELISLSVVSLFAEPDTTKLFYVFFLELTSNDGGEIPSDLKPETLAKVGVTARLVDFKINGTGCKAWLSN